MIFFYNLVNTTRCRKLLNLKMVTYSPLIEKNLNNVITPLTRGQSAWTKSLSETQRSTFSSNCISSNNTNFNSWLVGVTDGDGTFYFAKTKRGIWKFSFQIAQSSYNLRLLHFIKSKIKVGSITVDEKNYIAVYRVQNQKHIINHIIPIFDEQQLLTSKYYKYNLFKKAIFISNNNNLSTEKKNLLISNLKLKSQKDLKNYISPAWQQIQDEQLTTKKEGLMKTITKFWLIGFTEAEGSFYITKKSSTYFTHAFEITQKLDFIVMKAIALTFKLKVKTKPTYLTVVTTKKKIIQQIINFFFKSLKGMKSVEYKIWSRSFNKRKKGFEYLSNMRDLMRNIRSIRLNKNFKRTK